MKLYFAPSACSLCPHIVLREGGFDFKLDRVKFGTKQTASGLDFNAINPKGQVPALELGDGVVLTEVQAIVQWLADLKPETKLAPPAGTIERAHLQEWLSFIGTELHKSFGPLFNKKAPEEWKTIVKETLATRFDYLSNHLAKNTYVMGDTFTVADAYLFTILTWTAFVGIDLAKWSVLKGYQERIGARTAVKAALEAEAQK